MATRYNENFKIEVVKAYMAGDRSISEIKALQVDAVYRMLERMEKKTGIHTTPHMLRRYFGNMRRDAGWPLEMISEAYGHKHIDTTIKYLNLVDDQLMEASDQYYAKHSALYDVEKLL